MIFTLVVAAVEQVSNTVDSIISSLKIRLEIEFLLLKSFYGLRQGGRTEKSNRSDKKNTKNELVKKRCRSLKERKRQEKNLSKVKSMSSRRQ